MYKGYKYIDSDAHTLEPSNLWEKYLEKKYRDWMPSAFAGYENDPPSWHLEIHVPHNPDMPNFPTGRGAVLPETEEAYREYALKGFSPECYQSALKRTGIDYMVVYPTVNLYLTAVPNLSAEVAAAYRRAYNNWLHDFVTACGRGILGVGSIDLRDPGEAAREARRCVEKLGFTAITINPEPVDNHALHDEFFDPVWSTLEELDVPLGVHVGAGTSRGQVGTNYFPMWAVGRSISAFTIGNMIASLSLIAGGVLERHPKLRVVHLESGAGWAPFWVDRMKAGIAGGSRHLPMTGLTMDPVGYFKRQCYISADPDDPGIEMCVRYIGDANVTTATDFAHLEGRGYFHAIPDTLSLPIPQETKKKVMWDNPAKLYGIKE
ncbi:MAG: amidohydrolase [Chloroflexi bacterium]|nr:amidohydrolase [Chloroflexota bacterium]